MSKIRSEENIQRTKEILHENADLGRKEQKLKIQEEIGCSARMASYLISDAVKEGAENRSNYSPKVKELEKKNRNSGVSKLNKKSRPEIKIERDSKGNPILPDFNEIMSGLVMVNLEIINDPHEYAKNKIAAGKELSKLYGLDSPEFQIWRKQQKKKAPTLEETANLLDSILLRVPISQVSVLRNQTLEERAVKEAAQTKEKNETEDTKELQEVTAVVEPVVIAPENEDNEDFDFDDV